MSAARLALAWLQSDSRERCSQLVALARQDASFFCWMLVESNAKSNASWDPQATSAPSSKLLHALAGTVAELRALPLTIVRGCPRRLLRGLRKEAARQNGEAIHLAEFAGRLSVSHKQETGQECGDAARLLAIWQSLSVWLELGTRIQKASRNPIHAAPSSLGEDPHATADTPATNLPAGFTSEQMQAGAELNKRAQQLLAKKKPPKRIRRLLKTAKRSAKSARQIWKPLVSFPAGYVEKLVSVAMSGLQVHPAGTETGTFDRRLEAEKLESLAEFAAGAGHEINNPIAVINGRASLLAKSEPDPKRRRDLLVIKAQADRVYEMIAGMMFFARPPQPRLAEFDLAELVQTLLGEIGAIAEARQIELVSEGLWRPLAIQADSVQVAAALKAVYDNALFAIGSEGRIITTVTQRADANIAQVSITDTGSGISPEDRRHLFDPYFSGRQSGRGLGMGLSKAWRIIDQHAGSIDVRNESGHGATFVITLPIHQPGDQRDRSVRAE